MGAPPELIAERRAAAERPQGLPVMAENRPAVRLFMAVGTQWRFAGFGRPTGLDYAAVEATARGHDMAWNNDLIWRIRVMEREALASLRESRDGS